MEPRKKGPNLQQNTIKKKFKLLEVIKLNSLRNCIIAIFKKGNFVVKQIDLFTQQIKDVSEQQYTKEYVKY